MLRRATIKDLEVIVQLSRKYGIDIHLLKSPTYACKIQKNGFLVTTQLSKKQYRDLLKNLFLVYTAEDKIVGYLRIDELQEAGQEDCIEWYDNSAKTEYFKSPHRCIGRVCVDSNYTEKGIASKLLKKAELILKEEGFTTLFSFVVLSPITNMPSILFHEKNGFTRVATSISQQLFGLKNFRSILYYKKLQSFT